MAAVLFRERLARDTQPAGNSRILPGAACGVRKFSVVTMQVWHTTENAGERRCRRQRFPPGQTVPNAAFDNALTKINTSVAQRQRIQGRIRPVRGYTPAFPAPQEHVPMPAEAPTLLISHNLLETVQTAGQECPACFYPRESINSRTDIPVCPRFSTACSAVSENPRRLSGLWAFGKRKDETCSAQSGTIRSSPYQPGKIATIPATGCFLVTGTIDGHLQKSVNRCVFPFRFPRES